MKQYLIIYRNLNDRQRPVLMRQYGTSATDACSPIERDGGTEIILVQLVGGDNMIDENQITNSLNETPVRIA